MELQIPQADIVPANEGGDTTLRLSLQRERPYTCGNCAGHDGYCGGDYRKTSYGEPAGLPDRGYGRSQLTIDTSLRLDAEGTLVVVTRQGVRVEASRQKGRSS